VKKSSFEEIPCPLCRRDLKTDLEAVGIKKTSEKVDWKARATIDEEAPSNLNLWISSM
jgi:hypothetical protein